MPPRFAEPPESNTAIYVRTGADGKLTIFVCDADRVTRRRSVLAQLVEGRRPWARDRRRR